MSRAVLVIAIVLGCTVVAHGQDDFIGPPRPEPSESQRVDAGSTLRAEVVDQLLAERGLEVSRVTQALFVAMLVRLEEDVDADVFDGWQEEAALLERHREGMGAAEYRAGVEALLVDITGEATGEAAVAWTLERTGDLAFGMTRKSVELWRLTNSLAGDRPCPSAPFLGAPSRWEAGIRPYGLEWDAVCRRQVSDDPLVTDAELAALAAFYRSVLADAREYEPGAIDLVFLRDDVYTFPFRDETEDR